jgi:hypothetical protein
MATKQAMAQASGARLPPSMLERPKTGFTTPTRFWLAEAIGNRYDHRGLRGWARYIDELAA